ncbi:UspA [Streptomyces viridosporus ATCC 14672]|uniref:UspA n=1 Tax=Streptomyces viridosporus (strain ATCC 14672 / DSM 40746 / JCM 4963 / KCTC 9882 / NRRL B-12104 / FH 1290) TaxID=566461 RepID=D6A3W4_STRV1|nr:universal stress protein [Streptomyces viridosporus]EFE71518.1 UspA [Streptomyces viridosporus ATCC 14672]
MGQPVVAGVDSSPSSLDAVETAAHEAELHGVGLRLVHAFGQSSPHVPPAGPPWSPTAAGVRELIDGTLAEAERRARHTAPRVEIARDVTLGEPSTVLEIASRAASLVVIGSHDRSVVGGLLLGSTAGHLAAHGHCPVLVVRGRRAPADPVLLAVDDAPASAGAVAFAFAEARLHGAVLVALHVCRPGSADAYDGPADPPFVTYDRNHLLDHAERVLDAALAGHRQRYPDVTVRHRPVVGRVRRTLIEASASARFLVVGARGRGGFTGLLPGSVSQAVLHHARCPVAVVRDRRE